MYSVISLLGKRESNEDKHIIIKNIKNKKADLAPINLYGIFDGHGGKEVSSYLAKYIPYFFMNRQLTYPLEKKYICDVCEFIQEKLSHYPEAHTIGSTCLILIEYMVEKKKWITLINLGDCRAVLCRNNLAIALTKDHKPNWPEEKKRISKLGGKIIYDGYDWRINNLSVSRSFGDFEASPYVSHLPDLYKYNIIKGDKFIIVGCDGLWDVVSNEEAVNFILNECFDNLVSLNSKSRFIAKKLAQYAIKKGSGDNVTVIIVFL